jgi:hypothetical protein
MKKKPKVRILVGEWWEVRFQREGETHLIASGWPAIGVRPPGVWGTRQSALDYVVQHPNPHYRVIHVRRYRYHRVSTKNLP